MINADLIFQKSDGVRACYAVKVMTPLEQCGQNSRQLTTWVTREWRVLLILLLARLIPEMSCLFLR